jgi:hypothetical protein
MGNLNNLYISASFQSLLHLGNDSIISSSLVGVQDGFGNSIGIAVNSAGDLSLSGSFTSSLQQGYVLVGNALNKTSLVPTSSFSGGGGSDLTSLNAFTASQNTKNTTLASYTGSNDTKWTTLGTQTGSYVTSAITGSSLITASFSGNTLTFTKGNGTQFGVVIPDVSGSGISTGSLMVTGSVSGNILTFTKGDASTFTLTVATGSGGSTINTGSFATTGSNRFVGDQTITGSVNISGGEHLFIKREIGGAQQELRLCATDNLNNFAFIVTGSDQNPGQQVWGINTAGGIWGNSFDGGVVFNSYVSSSNSVQIGRGSDDGVGRNALNISRLSGQTGLTINQTGVGASWFIGTRENNNGNLIISSSAQDRYIEFVSSSGWIEVNSSQTNFNGNVSLRSRTDARNIFTDLGNGYTAQFDIISGSNANISGSLYVGGNKQFNVGAFQSNVNQSGSANVSQSMAFEVTDISKGVSIASNSRITLANSGTYNIQFSAQILADSGADDVYIWLKKNGTNVSASAGHVVLANNEELIAAWNYVVDAVANDYYEIAWQSTNGDALLLAENATGNIPSIPSVILTVTQVR